MELTHHTHRKRTSFDKNAPGCCQNCPLVRRQIDYAVGDDHINAGWRNGAEDLDIVLIEGHVGLCIPKSRGVLLDVSSSDGKLFVGHVDPDDTTMLTDQLGQHVAVATASTSKIKHSKTSK